MRRNGGVTGGNHIGLFGRPTILMAPVGDPAGGGGDPPEEDDFEVKFNKLFHKASAEREKRFEQKLTKVLDASLSTKIDELKAIIIDQPEREEPAGGDPTVPGKMAPEIEARFRQLEKTAKDANDLATKYKTMADDERISRSRAEERSALSAGLTGHVKPTLFDMVADDIHKKHVVRDPDTGVILWKNAEGEHVPLKDGIETWKKSDAGRELAPARDVRGSGGQNNGAGATVKPGEMNEEILGGMLSGGR